MPVDFQWTPVRRKFLKQCLQRKIEPALIATAISDVLCVPCDAGIVEEEAFKIALEIIDGLKPNETSNENISIVSHGPETRICQNEKCGKPFTVRLRGGGRTQKYCSKKCANIISHAKNKVTPLAILTITKDSRTDRPSLGKLDGVYADKEAMEAVSVPDVVETPPPAAFKQQQTVKQFEWTNDAVNHLTALYESNMSLTGINKTFYAKFGFAPKKEDLHAKVLELGICRKPIIPTLQKKIEINDGNHGLQALKENVEKQEDKLGLEFADQKFDYYVKNPIEHTLPIIKDEGQIPRGSYQSHLTAQVVVPLQGDPPPGMSAYDKMLRGEK